MGSSKPVDPAKYVNNPAVLIKQLKPRISDYEINAADACIQGEIDVFGKEEVGIIPSSLSTIGPFGALLWPDAKPERLVVLSYLWEILSMNEYFEDEQAAAVGATVTDPFHKHSQFDKPEWKQNMSTSLGKGLGAVGKEDPSFGERLPQELNAMVGLPQMTDRMHLYKDFEDFGKDRVNDIGWRSILASSQFAHGIHLTKEEEASVDEVFYPLYLHACTSYDMYGYGKDIEMGKTEQEITSSVILYKRLHGDSYENALKRIQAKAWEFEAEYIKRRDAFFAKTPKSSLSPQLQQYFDIQEHVTAGFAVWSMTATRHGDHKEGGEAYKKYYQHRLSQGATYFDKVDDSAPILTGGFQVKTA